MKIEDVEKAVALKTRINKLTSQLQAISSATDLNAQFMCNGAYVGESLRISKTTANTIRVLVLSELETELAERQKELSAL